MPTDEAGRARIVVVGCGHVGAVTAAGFAHLGHRVTGVDIDARLVQKLSSASAGYWEAGLRDLLQSGRTSKLLDFDTSLEAADTADFVFLCVDTPTAPDGAADMTHLLAAVDSLAPHLAPERSTVVVKSTAPVGTAERIEQRLNGRASDAAIPVVVNPEFLCEGTAVSDFLQPERIVVGARRSVDADRVASLYDSIPAPIVSTDLRSAEMIKYASNAFLAARVSLVNEVALLCGAVGADIDAVVEGIGHDTRIGPRYLKPGIGYGGSCLPKDVAALCRVASEYEFELTMLPAVQETNERQRTRAIDLLECAAGGLEGKTLAVWGVAFKGGTEDLRDSPALALLSDLHHRDVTVRAFDPSLTCGTNLGPHVSVCSSAFEACNGADVLAVLADWPEFATADFGQVKAVLRTGVVFDGRNCLDRRAVERAGLAYQGIGRLPTSEGSGDSWERISAPEGAAL